MSISNPQYRGRLAPSPTGRLHLGHARTFWIARQRCQAQGGRLVLRNEDLDTARCRPEFVSAMLEDLRWAAFNWRKARTAADRSALTIKATGVTFTLTLWKNCALAAQFTHANAPVAM